jgi:hypothetical protein
MTSWDARYRLVMRIGETQGGRGESSMTCLTYRDSKILDTSADACALFAVTRLFVFRARGLLFER